MEFIQSVSVGGRNQGPKTWKHAIADALSRIRFQLLGGLGFAIVLPAIARGQFERIGDPMSSYEHSIIGTTFGLLLGYVIFRKMTVLPGARAITNVVPAFLTSYMSIVAFFFLMRIDYSRYQFLMSFSLACIWFIVLLFMMARFRRPEFYFLPSKQATDLRSYLGVKWKVLRSHKSLIRNPHTPIVVDFHDPQLGSEWERTLAEEAIKGRRVFSAQQLTESLTGRVQIQSLSENTFGHLAPDSLYAPTKRYVDIGTALIAIALFWPVMIVTALAIKIESRGPAIFKQKRMGYRGNTFTVYKFRSMRVQHESELGLNADKTKSDDERITGIGKFIRRTRIDELPQVFNVLRGDMSWIGPRPETMRLSEWYENEISFYRYRHIVRPGLTGWAQVKQGHVTEVNDIRLKLEYDMYYVKHFSIWLDLLIAIKTVAVVFTGKGSR